MLSNSIGLYIHLPWCVEKCPYCDFNSHAIRDSLAEDDYVEALLSDLRFEAGQLTGRAIDSIFIGGGTPSLFSGKAIHSLLDNIHQLFSVETDVEITLEANPGTVEAEHFDAYRQAGVNRLSLGMQSLNDQMLARLGRVHRADESLMAYQIARDSGFDNINLDIMFGLKDLQEAIALQPEHLSWYQLTVEPNTQFAVHPPELPSDDICFEIQESGIEMLSKSGFSRYEVSAFSQPGRACRHNLNYWRFGDYLGIGAGAHGKLTNTVPVRYARYRHPDDYMRLAGSPAVFELSAPVSGDDLLFEYLLNNLRLVDGFLLTDMQQATGRDSAELCSLLATPISHDLIRVDLHRCQSTAKGFRFLNEILLASLPHK